MNTNQLATFGGGCFWCVEAVIQRLKGVDKVVSGYAGGHTAHPSYQSICSGTTGHAEVIQVSFQPEVISYEQLLMIFMTSHDPTTLNQQGADRGTQYRSVIFYHDETQKSVAESVLTNLSEHFTQKIVTELLPLPTFYPAEDYHQNYYNNNKFEGYCRVVIDPKVTKLKRMYSHFLQ